jgi:hypothetical protein
MEDKCKRCGAPVTSDQAFCQKCGAVIGMSAAQKADDPSLNLAATVVGKNHPSTPSSHKPRTTRPPAPPPPPRPRTPDAQAKSGGNTMTLVIVGFVAVLLIGGLLIMLLWMSF